MTKEELYRQAKAAYEAHRTAITPTIQTKVEAAVRTALGNLIVNQETLVNRLVITAQLRSWDPERAPNGDDYDIRVEVALEKV